MAYVTRSTGLGCELLVFRRTGEPEAGVQVPAGGIDEGEEPVIALTRELAEETGLGDLDVTCMEQVGDYTFYNAHNRQWQRRHVFWLTASRELLDRWDHVVTGDGEDAGSIFQIEWVPIEATDGLLAGRMGDQLPALRRAVGILATYSGRK